MKTAVVTGATSGIGFAVVGELAAKNWRVIAVGRSKENTKAAKKRLADIVPDGDIVFFYGDLSEQNDVHRLADEILVYIDAQCSGKLDALISNAGAVRNRYITTTEGYEMQFALNHLAGFLLSHRLLRVLKNGDGRLILTGSNSHKMMRIRWRDIMFQKHYRPLMAYKQSKLCNMLFAREFNRRYKKHGLRAYVVDPGLVNTDIGNKQTSGIVHAFWSLRKRGGVRPKTAAESYVHLCSSEKAPVGLYFHACSACAYNRRADYADDGRRLFELSERLCGITFEEGLES